MRPTGPPIRRADEIGAGLSGAMDHDDWIRMRQFLRRQVLHIHLPGHYPLPAALDILPADEEIAVLGDRNGGTILRAARSCGQGPAKRENCVSSGRVNGRHLSTLLCLGICGIQCASFMCGWPRLARDHLACSAEVACSHVWM